jgi:hypothetical protein
MPERATGEPEREPARAGHPDGADRLIQQALLQVLQPLIDPTFSEHSYGFRPGRSVHMMRSRLRSVRPIGQEGGGGCGPGEVL